MTHDAVSVAAMLLLAAFALERISRGLLFLLASFEGWREKFPEPAAVKDENARADATRRQQWAYFVICGALGVILVAFGSDFRILSAMGVTNQSVLDAGATWLVLVAGSDRLREILGDGKASSTEKTSAPVKIEGTVTLIGGTVADGPKVVADGRESGLRGGR